MSRRSPRVIIYMLPLMFVLMLVMFLPAIAGSAEAGHNVTELEHSGAAEGVLGALLAGDLILPALIVLICLAILFVGLGSLRRASR